MNASIRKVTLMYQLRQDTEIIIAKVKSCRVRKGKAAENVVDFFFFYLTHLQICDSAFDNCIPLNTGGMQNATCIRNCNAVY